MFIEHGGLLNLKTNEEIKLFSIYKRATRKVMILRFDDCDQSSDYALLKLYRAEEKYFQEGVMQSIIRSSVVSFDSEVLQSSQELFTQRNLNRVDQQLVSFELQTLLRS